MSSEPKHALCHPVARARAADFDQAAWQASCYGGSSMKHHAFPSRDLVRIAPAFALVIGCVDPEARFDEFADQVGPFEGGLLPDAGPQGPCTVAPGQVQGSYLLALSVALQPGTPILALLEVETTSAGFAFEGQALGAADRTTPVGAPIAAGPFPIRPDGSVRIELMDLAIDGAANPISGGAITADASLTGSLCGTGEFFCGIAEGNVTAPLMLDLSGSTFTLTRVEEGMTPPVQPAIDCEGTLADPI